MSTANSLRSRLAPPRNFPSDCRFMEFPDNAIAGLYERPFKYYAIAYSGARNRPDWHYSFATEQSRYDKISEWAAGLAAAVKSKADRRMARQAFITSLKVGDLLYGTWGYDQTNATFARVVRVIGPQTIDVEEVAGVQSQEDGFMTAKVRCYRDATATGPVHRKMVSTGNSIRWASYLTLGFYEEGRPIRISWYA